MLEQLDNLLHDGSPLSADEKQLLMYLLWLLRPADELKRQKALTRLVRPLNLKSPDKPELMNQINRTILEFEPVET